jgi:Ca2+:H+ antiporter
MSRCSFPPFGALSPYRQLREEEKALRRLPIHVLQTLRVILSNSWLNVLLPVVPVAIISYLTHLNAIIVFATNVIAIIPLSGLLTYATECISSESGDIVAALLNVTLGNLVEIVIL